MTGAAADLCVCVRWHGIRTARQLLVTGRTHAAVATAGCATSWPLLTVGGLQVKQSGSSTAAPADLSARREGKRSSFPLNRRARGEETINAYRGSESAPRCCSPDTRHSLFISSNASSGAISRVASRGPVTCHACRALSCPWRARSSISRDRFSSTARAARACIRGVRRHRSAG